MKNDFLIKKFEQEKTLILKRVNYLFNRYNATYKDVAVEIIGFIDTNFSTLLIKHKNQEKMIVPLTKLKMTLKDKTKEQLSAWAFMENNKIDDVLILEYDYDDVDWARANYLYSVFSGQSLKIELKEIFEKYKFKQLPFESDIEYKGRIFLAQNYEF